jgi:hypothetical protein
VALGAEDARGAAQKIGSRRWMSAAEIELPSALAPFLEACATLAADAARRGDIDAARVQGHLPRREDLEAWLRAG